jgi:hypothetical protein
MPEPVVGQRFARTRWAKPSDKATNAKYLCARGGKPLQTPTRLQNLLYFIILD